MVEFFLSLAKSWPRGFSCSFLLVHKIHLSAYFVTVSSIWEIKVSYSIIWFFWLYSSNHYAQVWFTFCVPTQHSSINNQWLRSSDWNHIRFHLRVVRTQEREGEDSWAFLLRGVSVLCCRSGVPVSSAWKKQKTLLWLRCCNLFHHHVRLTPLHYGKPISLSLFNNIHLSLSLTSLSCIMACPTGPCLFLFPFPLLASLLFRLSFLLIIIFSLFRFTESNITLTWLHFVTQSFTQSRKKKYVI